MLASYRKFVKVKKRWRKVADVEEENREEEAEKGADE